MEDDEDETVNADQVSSILTTKSFVDINDNPSQIRYILVGDIINYEITLKNDGNVTVYEPEITDSNADAGSILYVTGDDGDGILQIGETWKYSAIHTVTQGDLNAGSVINIATGSGSADTEGNGSGGGDDDTPVTDDSNQVRVYAEKATEVDCTVLEDLELECDNDYESEINDWLDIMEARLLAATTSGEFTTITIDHISNNYDTPPTVECSSNFSSATGKTITFTITDDYDRTVTCSAAIKIIDRTPPVIISRASDKTVECDGNGNKAELNAWLESIGVTGEAVDNCSDVSWTNDFEELSDKCGETGRATVTFTATDDCGNSSRTTAYFTIRDRKSPIITAQASDKIVECDGSGNINDLNEWLASNGGATATDRCSGVEWANDYDALSDLCGATGAATVTFTAYDDCGNSSTSVATFTIVDTTDPTITVEASNTTLECDVDESQNALSIWLASNGGAIANDDCSEITWSNDFEALSNDCGANGTVTVLFTATDDCNNKSTTSATFTINDITAPTITVEASNKIVECDGEGNTAELAAWLAANGGASAIDNCGGVTWSNDFEALSILCGATGITIVTFTATDDCGNASETIASFTIEDTTDPVAPAAPDDIQVNCVIDVPQNIELTATDNCSDDITVLGISSNNGGTGCVDDPLIITRNWTFTDDCGNESTATQTITVIDDTAPIAPTAPDDIEVNCLSDVPLNIELTAINDCSDDITVLGVNSNNGGMGCVDDPLVITRKWTFTDDCGNEVSEIQIITVIDDIAPEITIDAQNKNVECDGNSNTIALDEWLTANGGATANDNCSNITWSNDYDVLSNLCGTTGAATVTFVATDDCGNSSTTVATFTIEDTTEPVIIVQAVNLTVECNGEGNATALNAWLESKGGANATDECSGVIWSNNYDTLSNLCGTTGAATVTFTATDDCGNESTTVATFTIEDTTEPTITLEASNLLVECDGDGNTTAFNAWLVSNGGATATDDCGSVTWSNDYDAMNNLCGTTGTALVTFTATDDCGNTSTSIATFTIVDTTEPSITVDASNETVECDGAGNTAALNTWLSSNGGATAADDCSDITWSNNFDAISDLCGATGATTVTFTATDDCGNESTTTATFTIEDSSPPVMVCTPITVSLDENGSYTLSLTDINIISKNTIDNCSGDNITISVSPETFDCSHVGNDVMITVTAIDECGNSNTCTTTVTVEEGDADCGLIEIKAVSDVLTLVVCSGGEVSGTMNLFANDTGFIADQVTMTVSQLPDLVQVDLTDGSLTYTNVDAYAGTLTFTYTVCHNVNTDNCSEAEVTIELLLDTDCDGLPNVDDIDDDDDGILDVDEGNLLVDSDGDGIPDSLDIDSDGDGITDNEEWQHEGFYIPPTENDSNGNGWDDAYDLDSGGTYYEPEDTDNDGTPDYLSEDSDDDGILDIVEGNDADFDRIADVQPTGLDSDGDGLDDAYDNVFGWSNQNNPTGSDAPLPDWEHPENGYNEIREWRDPQPIEGDPGYQRPECDILIPNGFSPNGDGINDYFEVELCDMGWLKVEIYNRWGNLIFEKENSGTIEWSTINDLWDGTTSHSWTVGQDKLPPGTYFYILYLDNGNKPRAGSIFLNRY